MCLFFVNIMYSQEMFYGVTGGPSIAQTIRPNFGYYEPILGVSFSGFAERHKNHLYLKTGVNFAQCGFKQSLIYVDVNDVVLGEGAIESTRHQYLGLSAIGGVTYGDQVFGFLGTGLAGFRYLGTTVVADAFTLNNGQIIEAYRLSLDVLSGYDLSWISEIGVGYQFKNASAVFSRAQYNFGVLPVRYKNQATENPWTNRLISFELGFRFMVNEEREESSP